MDIEYIDIEYIVSDASGEISFGNEEQALSFAKYVSSAMIERTWSEGRYSDKVVWRP